MRASVDENLCIGCGQCERTCPAVFELNDDNISTVKADPVPADAEADCRKAAANCPVDAISLSE
jgi:ferredoxin